MSEHDPRELTRLTVDLLSAYFVSNSVPSDKLSELIGATRAALAGTQAAAAEDPAIKPRPAVSVEESIASRDYVISLIDGKSYKSLKRHLANNGLTPQQYRERYDLPADYPLVAPSYSEHRSAVAKRMGLGGKAQTATAEPAAGKAPAKKRTVRAKAEVSASKAVPGTTAPAASETPKAASKPATIKAQRKSRSNEPAPLTGTGAAVHAAQAAPKRRTLKIRTGADKPVKN